VPVFLREIGADRFVAGGAVFAAGLAGVSVRCFAVSEVRNEPVELGLKEPVALVSPGTTSIVTVGTAAARDVRAALSSTTFACGLLSGSGRFGSVESLKRACSATLMRSTVGELKNVFR